MSVRLISAGPGQVSILLVLVLLVSNSITTTASGGFFHQQQNEDQQQSTAVGTYNNEPMSSVFVSVMREFFNEINWKTISDARNEVIKFIQAADRLLRAFRNLTAGSKSSKEAGQDKRIFSSPWWSSMGSKTMGKDTLPALSATDTTQVKAMLERVACFVGYMKLLTHSNEALAELDASKVVTNLFGASKANSSGYFSNWFG